MSRMQIPFLEKDIRREMFLKIEWNVKTMGLVRSGEMEQWSFRIKRLKWATEILVLGFTYHGWEMALVTAENGAIQSKQNQTVLKITIHKAILRCKKSALPLCYIAGTHWSLCLPSAYVVLLYMRCTFLLPCFSWWSISISPGPSAITAECNNRF